LNPGHSTSWGSPQHPWIGGWVGPRAGLDVVEKIESLCTCQEFGPQSSILYPNHYTARMNEEKLQKKS